MVDPQDYVDGETVRFGALATTILGGAILAWFQNVIQLILNAGVGLADWLGAIASDASWWVYRIFYWPSVAVGMSFEETAGVIPDSNIAGLALAFLITAILLYIVEKGVSYVG